MPSFKFKGADMAEHFKIGEMVLAMAARAKLPVVTVCWSKPRDMVVPGGPLPSDWHDLNEGGICDLEVNIDAQRVLCILTITHEEDYPDANADPVPTS